jgi:hypothetical protein
MQNLATVYDGSQHSTIFASSMLTLPTGACATGRAESSEQILSEVNMNTLSSTIAQSADAIAACA